MKKQNSLKKPTFVDLFAGIGGFRIGFEREGYKCVFSSEINNYCQKTYFANFGELPKGDITKIETQEMPKHAVLAAGFPCQPFSISGKMRGFEDTRGTLFFDILRIVKDKKPSVLLLENVKHLVYHDGKKTLETMLKHLKDLGYIVEWGILNASDFGVPQNRERIFIVGSKNKRFDFRKIRKKERVMLKSFLEDEGDFDFLNKREFTFIETPVKQKSGLIFVGYRNKKIRENGVRPGTEHLSRVHKQPNRIYSAEGIHPTLPSQESSGRFFILVNGKTRKLTLKECVRVMGFPEGFKIPVPNGEAYKQIGNAVCIPVVEELAYQIKKQLLS